MKVRLANLGALGIVTDKDGHETTHNAWSDGLNVSFRDGYAQSIPGHSAVFGTPGCIPQWMVPYTDPASGDYLWIYAGLDGSGDGVIYTWDGAVHTNVTRIAGTMTISSSAVWTGGVMQGIIYANTPGDTPQKFDPANGDTDFIDLPNWPTDYTARVIRPFREFLVALDITDDLGFRNPYRLMWSEPADPFTVPTTWTPLATNLAGDAYLSEGADYLIDCLPLRGANIIYKQSTTWIMRYVGGLNVFSFDRIFSEHGMLAPRCAKAFGDGMHFVATVGDIIVHDGNSARSVADKLVRERIFGEIDPTNYYLSYVFANYAEEEMWFCYPQQGATYPNIAAIWNITSGAWSFRELPDASHIGYGVINAGNDTWDSDAQVWDNDTTLWDELAYNPAEHNVLIASAGANAAGSAFYRGDTSNQFAGANYRAYLEKTGLDLVGNAGEGVAGENRVWKEVTEVWPGIHGGPVNISVGSCDSLDGIYEWEPAQSFDPATQYKLDFRSNGRFHAYRIESNDDVMWRITYMDFEVYPNGER